MARASKGKVKRRGASTPAVNPAEIPAFERPSTKILEKAANEERPLVIYFPGEGAGDAEFSGEQIAELSKTDAIFVRVPYNPDREDSPWAEDSAVPSSKLLSENPSRDYRIRAYPTFLVADSFGNEVYRITRAPSAAQLQKYFKQIEKKTAKLAKKLNRNLKNARTAWESKDETKAIKAILKNFKEDVVGLEAQEETVRLYHEVLDSARETISSLTEDGSADSLKKLKSMKTTYKKTDLLNEIAEAIESLKG